MRDVPDLLVFLFELYFLMLLPTKHKQDFMSHTHIFPYACRCAPAVTFTPHPPARTTVPTHPDFSELAVAQFLNQLEGFAWNLPHILGLHR